MLFEFPFQQIQFAILIVHFLYPILTDCAYPKALSFIGLSQNLFMFLLFSDFYYKAYMRRPRVRQAVNHGLAATTSVANESASQNTTTTTLSNGTRQHEKKSKGV